ANLLQFARKHDPEKKMISINRVVEDSIELNAYRLKVNNIQIAQELDPTLPETAGDFFQLQQVFVNLMTNAEQAMTQAHGKGKLTIKTQRSGTTIHVTFTDDGPGIEKETLKQVFDPFFTTKEVGQGTGLGLSICFGIVEQHGGTIGAKSKLGKGATFTVELPIVSADATIAGQSDPVPTK
ncbi:MAG: ATP-binding protein, partial [Dehalococcoidia bacterium]